MLYCKRIDDSHDRRAVQHSEGISLLINAVRSEYGIMITESDISYGKLGKPYLPEYPRIFFSIAHCSGLAVCLVSDKVCGVDAEALRKVSAGSVKRVFSQAEEKLISSAPESDRDIIFTTLWTLKEAYSKADGSAITMEGRYFEGTTVVFNKDTAKLESVGGSTTNLGINAAFSQLGGNFSDITIDLSECTNYDNKGTSTIGATSGDLDGPGTGCGRRLGDMIGVSIQKDGMIYASYDNGMTKLLGQIATAAFANASGLEKEGDNLYSATLNSGEFDGIGVDITAGGGYMSTGHLEMSNVDLSSEFTEMITTQRGFQANSRIITVSDTLLEELTNLKR